MKKKPIDTKVILKAARKRWDSYLAYATEHRDRLFFDILNVVLVLFVLGLIAFWLIWLKLVFAGTLSVHPIAFSLGGFGVHWYGIIFACAFLISAWLVIVRARKRGHNLDLLVNMLFGATVAGFIGARLVFVLLNIQTYATHPLAIVSVWQGGLSYHGAVLGGLLFIIFYARYIKWDWVKMLDLFAPAFLLGQAIGRWGNFVNQELFGYPTTLPWKMYISPFNRPWLYRTSAYFHPVFLYESLLVLIAFVALLLLARNKKTKKGDIVLWYFILYSFIRFVIEFVRIEPKVFIGLTLAQLISIALFAAASTLLYRNHKRKKR